MDEEDPTCKGCRASVHVTAVDADRALAEYLAAHPGVAAAAPERVEQRLALCRACPDLRYGATCMHCGCLVAVRTRIVDAHCPRPGSPAW